MVTIMSVSKWILIPALVAFATCLPAQSCFSGLPDTLRSAVEQDNWTIVQPSDLSEADFRVWNADHPGQCPGVAARASSPKAKPYFIVALILHDGPQNLFEKVLLVTSKKDQPVTKVAIATRTVNVPYVVWLQKGRLASGNEQASVANDSFIFEKLVSPASRLLPGSHVNSFAFSK